ncbi:MAG: hypothetical protein SHS37scaffold537_15 [Phage 68_12]|nr:MAG: hypothetical protein SHS37scaffold537_15 [Phage 68_12]
MTEHQLHLDPAIEHRVGRAELWKRGLIVFIAVAVSALFVVLGVVIARQGNTIDEIRATQQEGSPSQQRLIDLSNLIAGCVTPGRDCYENGQRQTAGAVSSINEITAITVACGDLPGEQTVTQIRACVTQQLEPEKK